jgi:aminoglycoside phosphotransferase (APT) family kinase protein
MSEIKLGGGRVTGGVVRAGDTLRRPPKPNSPFVRALLAHLHEQGFDAAPRYLGTDERGREMFSFLPGEVAKDLNPTFSDETLASAAQLIRRYHDAKAGSDFAGLGEVVCHNDFSPCNFVFRDGRPVGIIDFDTAAPGPRLPDVTVDDRVIDAIVEAVVLNLDRLRVDRRFADLRWWQAQLDWIKQHRVELAPN